MTAIKSVLVQVSPQSDGNPGRVTEGFYKIEGGYLQMTYRDGRALDNPLYRVLLADGVNTDQVAAGLAKGIRAELSSEIVPGFNREMSYQKAFVA